MCILCEISGEMSPYPPGAGAPTSGLSADSPQAAAGALVASSGNPYIDGVLSGYKWNGAVTYSFPDVRADYEASYPEADATGFGQLSFNQMQAVRYILEGTSAYVGGPKMLFGSIESFTNLSITDAGSNGADIRLGQSSSANPTAYAYYPSGSYAGGDVWFGTNYNYTNPVLGSYQYATHIHELGHALGLKHGHQPGGVSNNPVPADRDSLEFTVMTYRSFIGGSISGWTNEQYGYPQTYMMLDIAALQHMYGADFTVNSGNTIYTWSATTGEMFLNGVGQGQPGSNRVFLTIWDGDGIDTYDMSNYSNAVTIDLSPGSWSMTSTMQRAYLGGGQYARGTVFNALQYQGDARSLIENAIGGSGDDIIAGNSADNALSGGGGNDTLSGGAGIDTLDGGTGSDTMTGGVGNDTYYVDSLSDLIAENLGEGTDSVLVFVSGYTLAANTENGHVATSTGLALTGNGLDNYLVGNIGNDTLLGGSGNDTIEGGSGADTVNGGVGIDTLTGGTGIDTFVFADGDTGAAIGSRDLITDYDPGTDLIDLTGIDADTSTGIVDAFRWLVTAAFDGISAALHYFYDMIRGVTVVEGDVNGDGTADFAIDLFGNKSLGMADFTVGSLLAPAAPTISSFSGDSGTVGDGITNDNTLTLTGTAAANSTVQVYDGATLLGTATANGSGAWSFFTAMLADGSHSFTATAPDAANNTQAASLALSITVDTAAPAAPVISAFSSDSGAVGDGITDDNTLTLTGTAAANSTMQVYDGATLLGTATANGSGAWSYTTAALANATHSFTATATDAAGNTGAASAALSVTVDTTAPSAPTVSAFSTDSGTVGDGITNDNTLTLTGTTAPNSTVKVYDGATLLGQATANGSGAWSYSTAALVDGSHSLTATATDAAGNTSAASAAQIVTVDTAAPGAPPMVNYTVNGNTVTLTGTADANSTVKLYDGSTLLGSANGSAAWSYTTAALTNGSHSLTAMATDAAGNTSAASAALSVITGGPGDDLLAGWPGADIMIGGTGNDTYVTDNIGDMVIEVGSAFTPPSGWTVKGMADFNNDGLTDVIVTKGSAAQALYLDAAGAVTGTVALWNTSNGWSLTGIGDFNGDGKKDFLYTRNSDGLQDAVILNNLTVVQEIIGHFTPDPVQSLGATNEGTDTVQASISYTLLNGVENLTLTGAGNINGTGNGYDNVIIGNTGNNILTGGGGNDTLDGGLGADIMIGGTGNDTYVVDDVGDVVTEVATSGFTPPAGWTVKGTADFNNDGLTDVVLTNGAATQVWYLNAAYAVTGTVSLWNTSNGWTLTGIGDFNGDGKKDLLYTRNKDGLQDAAILNNLTVVQEITGHFTPDPIQSLGGNEGIDTVQASISYVLPNGAENLTLTGTGNINGTGNAYDNVITGNAGNNILTGLGGNDTLDGGTGADIMIGGTGNDTYVVDNAGDVVTEAGFTPPSGWTIKGTADFNNDGLTDVVLTNGSATQVWYLNAAGAVAGTVALWNTSNGWSLTGIGDFNGDGKKDFLYTRSSDGLQDAVILNNLTVVQEIVGRQFTPDPLRSVGGNEGTDTVQASISYTLSNGVENLTLTGTGNINGTGNGYDNVIIGNTGNNTLTGGGGNDTLTGGVGSDIFVFNFPADGVDAITDFVHGADFLQISAPGFGGGLSSGTTVTVVNAASAGAASNPGTDGYFIFDNKGPNAGTLYWDATGGSGADAVALATLSNLPSLLPSDFHVV